MSASLINALYSSGFMSLFAFVAIVFITMSFAIYAGSILKIPVLHKR